MRLALASLLLIGCAHRVPITPADYALSRATQERDWARYRLETCIRLRGVCATEYAEYARWQTELQCKQ